MKSDSGTVLPSFMLSTIHCTDTMWGDSSGILSNSLAVSEVTVLRENNIVKITVTSTTALTPG